MAGVTNIAGAAGAVVRRALAFFSVDSVRLTNVKCL